MSFIDDWNNQANAQVAQTGQSHSWDDFYRQQQQQELLKQLQDKNTAAATPKGNFLTSLLPTGGGIGGALAGGATGATIGSAVPVVGTAIGGLLGAILGGAGGSALGKVGENSVEGESDLGKGVAQEALLGGVTSLPLGAGLKLAGAGLRTLTGVGKAGVSNLVDKAALQTVGKGTAANILAGRGEQSVASTAPTLTQKLGQKLETASNKGMASQSGLTPAQARQSGVNTLQTFGNINQRTGLSNLEDMTTVGKTLTGGKDSLLDNMTRGAVDSTSGVSVGDLRARAQTLLDDKGSLIPDAERKQLLKSVSNSSVAMHGGSAGSLSPLANSSAALDRANEFRDTASHLTSGFSTTAKDKQLAKVYNGLASHIEDSIYKSPGVNESIPVIAKAGRDDLLLKAQEATAAGNAAQATAYTKLADEVAGIKSVNELRSMKKDFVNIGKIDKATAQADGNRTFTGGNITSKVGQIGRNPLNLIAAPLDAATPSIAGKGAQLARTLQAGPGNTLTKTAGQGVLPLAVRQFTGNTLLGSAQQASGPQLDQNGLTADDEASLQNNPLFAQDSASTAPTAVNPANDTNNPFGASLTQVATALQQATAKGDSKGYATLSDLYDKISAYQAAQTKASTNTLNSTQQQQANNANSGLADLQTIAQALQSDPSVAFKDALPGGSVARGLTGTTDYQAAKQNVIDVIARLRSGAAITADEAKTYSSLLPAVGDSQASAMNKLQRLQSLLSSFANPQSSGSNLSDALSAIQ